MNRDATTKEHTNVIFRIPVEMRDRLKAAAAADHRTMSQELRYLVEQRLKAGDKS